jgi:hypothetical protein
MKRVLYPIKRAKVRGSLSQSTHHVRSCEIDVSKVTLELEKEVNANHVRDEGCALVLTKPD